MSEDPGGADAGGRAQWSRRNRGRWDKAPGEGGGEDVGLGSRMPGRGRGCGGGTRLPGSPSAPSPLPAPCSGPGQRQKGSL